MLLFILITISINQFCIPEVSSRYLLINVEEERNTRHQTNGLSDNKKYIPKNSDLYETGYDLSEDPGTFANETFSDSWGHDLAETGGCSCNCKGECTPKGCNGARGKSTSRSFGGFQYLYLNTQRSLYSLFILIEQVNLQTFTYYSFSNLES